MKRITIVRESGGPLTVRDVSRLLDNARASGAVDEDRVLGVSRTSRWRRSTLTVHATDGVGSIVLRS